MLILNPQWQGWGASDALAAGARQLATELAATPDLTVPVPGFHDLPISDRVLGLHEQVDQTRWLLAELDLAVPELVVQLAGDCGAELAPISWLNARHLGSLTVVWVDAHGDLNTPESSPSGTFHGMVLRTLLGDGPAAMTSLVREPIRSDHVHLVGVRALDPAEAEYIEQERLVTTSTTDLSVSGPVYLHIDLDAFDPPEFGHVPFPEPDGLSLSEVELLMRRLMDNPEVDLVGVGLTESIAVDSADLVSLGPVLAAVDQLLGRSSEAGR